MIWLNSVFKKILTFYFIVIFDQNKIDTKFYPYLVKSIFEDKGNADHLFALKLALFEIDDVRDSDNMEQKTAIRKSKTKIEAIQAAIF